MNAKPTQKLIDELRKDFIELLRLLRELKRDHPLAYSQLEPTIKKLGLEV